MSDELKTVCCVAVMAIGVILLILGIMQHCYKTDKLYVENGFTRDHLPSYTMAMWVKSKGEVE